MGGLGTAEEMCRLRFRFVLVSPALRVDSLSEISSPYSFPSFSSTRSAFQEPAQIQVPVDAPTDEASALAAMFAATSQQWQQTQEQMAT